MKLVNAKTEKVVSTNLVIADNLVKATIGLLGKPKGTAMLFQTRFGIHTFFMKYPIDILILDSNMKIVKIKKNLQPNQIFFWNPQFNHLIEISSGKELPVSLNDILKIL